MAPRRLIVLSLAGLALVGCSSSDGEGSAASATSVGVTPTASSTVVTTGPSGSSTPTPTPTPATTDAPTTIAPTTTMVPPSTRSPRLFGDADLRVPAGIPGTWSALPAGPAQVVRGFDGISNVEFVLVPFVVWNLTQAELDEYQLDVTATDPTTGKAYLGAVSAMTPSRLAPGEWGLATVAFFDVASLPPTAVYDAEIGPPEFALTDYVDLYVTGVRPGALPGTAEAFVMNDSGGTVASPFTFVRYCVDGGRIVSSEVQLPGDESHEHSYLRGDIVTVPFTTGAACPATIVGAVSFRR